MDINQWYADKCGVTEEIDADVGGFNWYTDTHITYGGKWSITDPRCIEICVEKYGIQTHRTVSNESEWYAQAEFCKEANYQGHGSYGKTRIEAEIACLTAIYEAEKDG